MVAGIYRKARPHGSGRSGVRRTQKFIRAFDTPGRHSAGSGKGMQVRLQQGRPRAGGRLSEDGGVYRIRAVCIPMTTPAAWAANLRTPNDFPFAMHCFVYASQRKADTYVWLARRDNLEILPPSLLLMLGQLRFVLEVELHAERRLPQEDVDVVMDHLRTQGWHLQLPPQQTLATPPAPPDPSNTLPRQGE